MNTHLKWNPIKATILLPIQNPVIESTVASYAANHGFALKPEFHASIIGLQNGKKIIEKHGDNENMLSQVCALADDFQWQVNYLPEHVLIEKYYDQEELAKSGYENIPPQTRRTIIQLIELPDLVSFYKKLTDLTDISFDIPFAHITLFSWCDYEPLMTQGIGLYSVSDFEGYKIMSL